MSLICVENVSKVYAQGELEVRALDGVSLEIAEKCFLAITGPSGSGKTTLLNLVGGLDTPTSGAITLNGKRVDKMTRPELAELRLANIGFVFQAYNLIPVLSALENVAFVMQLQGVPAAERNVRAREILADVGLGDKENSRPGQLSGGQQQRVAVARAIVSNPSLVLADEPTANLDSVTSGALLELMQRMNEERGVSFVFSTHDELVMRFARGNIELLDGRVCARSEA